MNLGVLSYDANKNFVVCNEAIKENLRQYLRNYRLLTEALNIRDIYIINLSVDIEIITRPGENSNEVNLRVLEKAIEWFDNDRMQPNAPIIISNLTSMLDGIQGVQSIVSVKFKNEIDMNQGYSGNVYPVDNAIRNGVLYPSTDFSIFEIKHKKRDLRVRTLAL
jgi:hypothetical protein